MSPNTSRRQFLGGTAAALASIVGAGTASAASSSTVAAATPSEDANAGTTIGTARSDDIYTISVDAQSYEREGKDGKVPERLNYKSPNYGVGQINTIVWNGEWGLMKNTLDDARWGGMTQPDPDIPELSVHNELDFDDPDSPDSTPPRYSASSDVDVHQKLLFSQEREALLVDGAVQAPGPRTEEVNHTVYTHWTPAISPLTPSEGFLKSRDGYDVIVVKGEDEPYIAYAHTFETEDDSPNTSFDGQRIGDGETDKSAWTDIYEEADGWIDSNTSNSRGERDVDESTLDVGVGRYIGTSSQLRWTAAFGFGDSWTEAADAAVDSIEAGYESERSSWI